MAFFIFFSLGIFLFSILSFFFLLRPDCYDYKVLPVALSSTHFCSHSREEVSQVHTLFVTYFLLLQCIIYLLILFFICVVRAFTLSGSHFCCIWLLGRHYYTFLLLIENLRWFFSRICIYHILCVTIPDIITWNTNFNVERFTSRLFKTQELVGLMKIVRISHYSKHVI